MLQIDMQKGQTGFLKNGCKFRIEDNDPHFNHDGIRFATVYDVVIKGDCLQGVISTNDIATVEVNGVLEPLDNNWILNAQWLTKEEIKTQMKGE
jgi:hypothetical protein